MKHFAPFLTSLLLMLSLLSNTHAAGVDLSITQFSIQQSATSGPESGSGSGDEETRKKKEGEEEDPDC